MANPPSLILLLCEDQQQDSFVRRYLKKLDYDAREIRSIVSPHAKNSAYDYVISNYPESVSTYRKRSTRAATALFVMIDGDTKVEERRMRLRDKLSEMKQEKRTDGERIMLLVPNRNIET